MLSGSHGHREYIRHWGYIESEIYGNVDELIFDFWEQLAREEGYLAHNKSLNYFFDQLAGGLKGIDS